MHGVFLNVHLIGFESLYMNFRWWHCLEIFRIHHQQTLPVQLPARSRRSPKYFRKNVSAELVHSTLVFCRNRVGCYLCPKKERSLPCTIFFDAFSRSPSFNLGNASSHSFNSSFLHGLSCMLSPHCIANVLTTLSSSPHDDLTTSRLLLPSSRSVLLSSTLLAS